MKVYAFLIRRPRDKEAWPVVFSDRERAERYSGRVSVIVEVNLEELTPVEQAILAARDGPNDPEAPSDPVEFLAWLNEEEKQ